MAKINVHLVEDDEKWMDFISVGFEQKFKTEKLDIHITKSSCSKQARFKLRRQFFHVMSLDQNMPEVPGGVIAPEHGVNVASAFANPPSLGFGCVFTAYPADEPASKLARVAGLDYKKKGVRGVPGGMSAGEYAHWFVAEFRRSFLPGALRKASQATNPVLAARAKDAGSRLEAQLGRMAENQDSEDDWLQVMLAFDRLREETLIQLAGFSQAIGAACGLGLVPPGSVEATTPSRMEDWLKTAWTHFKGREKARYFNEFLAFHGDSYPGQSVLQAAASLRLARNKLQHNKRLFATREDYEHHFVDLCMLMAGVGFVARQPIMAGAMAERTGILRFRNLNLPISGPEELAGQYDTAVLRDPDSRGKLFTPWQDGSTPDGGRDMLLPLDPAFSMKRNTARTPELFQPRGREDVSLSHG